MKVNKKKIIISGISITHCELYSVQIDVEFTSQVVSSPLVSIPAFMFVCFFVCLSALL